jgi:hypothetical protein
MVFSWVGRALQTPLKDREMLALHLRSLHLGNGDNCKRVQKKHMA